MKKMNLIAILVMFRFYTLVCMLAEKLGSHSKKSSVKELKII